MRGEEGRVGGDAAESTGPLLPRRPAQADPPAMFRMLANGALLLYPLVVCVGLYGEWIVAWTVLGHPPRPSLDDPKDITVSGALHPVVGLLIVGLVPASALAFAFAVAAAVRQPGGVRWLVLRTATIVLLLALVAGLAWWDPGQVIAWWFD